MWERRQKEEPSKDLAPCWPGPKWIREIEDHENGGQARKKVGVRNITQET